MTEHSTELVELRAEVSHLGTIVAELRGDVRDLTAAMRGRGDQAGMSERLRELQRRTQLLTWACVGLFVLQLPKLQALILAVARGGGL